MSDPVTRLNAALEGRYVIERELGEGGMATVYLADDLKHERKLALKVVKPPPFPSTRQFGDVYIVTNWFEELNDRMGN